jgi:hypothetical protein
LDNTQVYHYHSSPYTLPSSHHLNECLAHDHTTYNPHTLLVIV